MCVVLSNIESLKLVTNPFPIISSTALPKKWILFLIWLYPICHVVLRGWIYLKLCSNFSWHSGLSVFCGGLVMLMWGNFHYLMFIARCSFQRQFQLVTEFFESNQNNLDVCRQALLNATKDFTIFRQFVDLYMFMIIPVGIWSVTTNVVWLYYLAFESSSPRNDNNYAWFQQSLAILISSENVFFLGITLWSFGGVNVSYIWHHFYLNLLVVCRSSKYNTRIFWLKIMRVVDYVYEETPEITLTFVIAALTFYMAIELGEEQWTLFIVHEPSCNGNLHRL